MATRPFTKRGGWGTHTKATYRSGLEEKIAAQLEALGLQAVFEQYEVRYTIPESPHKYTPDFVLDNGIIIEGKGIFDADDRKKHVLIREQHPELDIRFVFTNSKAKLYKGSPTSYGTWCDKNKFLYADKLIPRAWLTEPRKGKGLPAALIAKATKKEK